MNQSIYSSPFLKASGLSKLLIISLILGVHRGAVTTTTHRVDKHWRLIGWGQIRRGNKIVMYDNHS